MIIAGWGKDAKDLAFAGIQKCGKCRNYAPIRLYEVSSRVTLYFIPVAKFNKKYYLVCPVCQAGAEVDQNEKDEILRNSNLGPTQDEALAIWNMLDAECAQFIARHDADESDEPSDADRMELTNIVAKVKNAYPGVPNVGYVVVRYMESLQDTDRPK